IGSGCSPHRRQCAPRRWTQLPCSTSSIPAGTAAFVGGPGRGTVVAARRPAPRRRPARGSPSPPAPTMFSGGQAHGATPSTLVMPLPMAMLLGHIRSAAGLLYRLHTPLGSGQPFRRCCVTLVASRQTTSTNKFL
uniref:Uncharacterized protein n=1 Tax=Triticum urartu TaxID=4572 RepID=A0A8R7U4W6_TRIUA